MRSLLAVLIGLVLLLPPAAQAAWLKAESPHFIVYSDGDEASLRAYAADLETFDSLLRLRHGVRATDQAGRKLPVYLVGDREALRRSWSSAPSGAAGYYAYSLGDIFAVAVREGGDDSTVKHEYVHHFMLQHLSGAYPPWFVEGYAEYLAATAMDAGFVRIGGLNARVYAATARRLPVADLLGKSLREVAPEDMEAFYANAWLLTHYMVSDPARAAKLQAYLAAVGRGEPSVEAMETALGMNLDQIGQALAAYRVGGMSVSRYTRAELRLPEAKVEVATLPASADDLLLERLQVTGDRGRRADPQVIGRIRAAAARHPGDRLATLTLGQAEVALGDRGRGVALLQGWVSGHPGDAEALIVLGAALLDQADRQEAPLDGRTRRQAAGHLTRALALAPDDYRAPALLTRARLKDPEFTSDQAQTLLRRAFAGARQVPELRINLARVLISRRENRAAIALLTPLANSPHDGGAANWARNQLRQLSAAN